MDNLKTYNAVRHVPKEALKEIAAGRLKGKSDINPMWRIKALTEQFGICGIGWKYVVTDKRLEKGAGEEVAAFVDINLYIKIDGEWSAPIPGTGGSSFVANERNGLYTSDECFKMALTDAISVSCKALGMGADVYWDKDATKYTPRQQTASATPAPAPAPRVAAAPSPEPWQVAEAMLKPPAPSPAASQTRSSGNTRLASEPQRKKLYAMIKDLAWTPEEAKGFIEAETGKASSKELTMDEIQNIFVKLQGLIDAREQAQWDELDKLETSSPAV